jgi:hypothetical protein
MNPVALLLFLAIPLVGYGIYWSWKKEQERRAGLHAFALSKGWRYARDDPYDLPDRWSVRPFHQGHSRVAYNVIEGTDAAWPFLSFDYKYEETSTDSDGDSTTTTYHHTVTALRLPTVLPGLTIGGENLLTRLGGALGMDDIELESEDFNRRFRIRSGSPKFAHDVLHPRTMEHLLRVSDCPAIEFAGSEVLAVTKGRSSPTLVLGHLAVLRGVVEGIPSFVWKDHGFDPGPVAGGVA